MGLLTIKEACDYLRINRFTLYKYCKAGRIKSSQSNPSAPYRFRQEWLDDFVDGNLVHPAHKQLPKGKEKFRIPEWQATPKKNSAK